MCGSRSVSSRGRDAIIRAVDDAYVLAGHAHPVYRIAMRTDALRVPCLLLGIGCGVLPVFGSLTDGAREAGRVAKERDFILMREKAAGLSG